ncbi:hypothetical protein AAFC00_002462 [Neodothiora populina]|uniref:chitinase n=1 Tax=Neodothiora populina TaxID=2781224 RepID=A0ABR3P756_9PEZI
MSRLISWATLCLAATKVAAQTFTSCNPLNSTDCPSDVALGTSHTWNWTSGDAANSKVWNTTAGAIDWTEQGAAFTIKGKGDSPTLQSNFYIFFGQISVVMRCAPGTGIISSIVLESDDLDEVDWEFIGGNTTTVETNYFGKGNTTSYDRAIYYAVDNPQENFHNYTTTWTKEKIEWIIDGDIVRTLKYEDALDGKNFPQTPMNVRLGIWAGGDPSANSNWTVEWAGGETNYKDGPYSMLIERLDIEDYSSGSKYSYGDTSGSYESIKIESGNSTIAQELNTVHGVKARFSNLPKGAQIAIVAVVISICAIGLAAFIVCCVRSRKAGRAEHAINEAEWEKHQMEMSMLKQQHQRMRDGDDYDDDDYSYRGAAGYEAKGGIVSGGRYV